MTTLDRWMVASGTTNAQLAAACGVSAPTVWRWRMGECSPRDQQAQLLARAILARNRQLLDAVRLTREPDFLVDTLRPADLLAVA